TSFELVGFLCVGLNQHVRRGHLHSLLLLRLKPMEQIRFSDAADAEPKQQQDVHIIVSFKGETQELALSPSLVLSELASLLHARWGTYLSTCKEERRTAQSTNSATGVEQWTEKLLWQGKNLFSSEWYSPSTSIAEVGL